MDDTKLYSLVREYALDGIWEAFQPIYAGNNYVFHSSVLKVC